MAAGNHNKKKIDLKTLRYRFKIFSRMPGPLLSSEVWPPLSRNGVGGNDTHDSPCVYIENKAISGPHSQVPGEGASTYLTVLCGEW